MALLVTMLALLGVPGFHHNPPRAASGPSPSPSAWPCAVVAVEQPITDAASGVTLNPPVDPPSLDYEDACTNAETLSPPPGSPDSVVIQYGLLDAPALEIASQPAFRVIYEGGSVCIHPRYLPPAYRSASPGTDSLCAPNRRSAVLLSGQGALIGSYAGGDLDSEPIPSPSG